MVPLHRSWSNRFSFPGIPFYIVTSILAATLLQGCVERKLLIRSEPDQATVFLDDQRVGVTPVEVPFVHYGTRRVVLEKQEFAQLVSLETIRPPWYQVFPLDLFFDLLIPFRVRDQHELEYHLERREPVVLSDEDLDRLKERGLSLEKRLPDPSGQP